MTIRFMSEIPPPGTRPDLPPLDGAHAARGTVSMIPPDVVRANLMAAIKEISEFLNESAVGVGAYALDEVELTLHMDQKGEVNIFFGKAGLGLSQGIRLNWKRQKDGQPSSAVDSQGRAT